MDSPQGLDQPKEAVMAQTAIVGEKVGMTQKWVDDRMLAVTVLRVEPMRVVQIKTTERDGYTALGFIKSTNSAFLLAINIISK